MAARFVDDENIPQQNEKAENLEGYDVKFVDHLELSCIIILLIINIMYFIKLNNKTNILSLSIILL